MKPKILVTGGAGYIGNVLIDRLFGIASKVTVVDNLMYDQDQLARFSWRDDFEFIYGDVRDYQLIERLTKDADVIFPLAAIVGFPACQKDKSLAWEVNFQHVANIVRFVKEGQKIIFPNTNSAYGTGEGSTFCTEKTQLKPISVYGLSKCDAEKVVLSKGGIVFRLATLFGVSPRIRLDLLVNDFVYKAVTDGYIVLFEKDFMRNYIHIQDVVSAFIFMLDNYDKYRGEVFNVGLSSANLSKYELAMKIKEHVPTFSVQSDEIRTDPDKRNYFISNEKIEKAGCVPTWDLDDGIRELIKACKIYGSLKKRFTNM